MDIDQAMAKDLTDSVGASRWLTERFGRPFSVDSIHQLVKQNRLRAYMFHDGKLIERKPSAQSRGKDLLFLYSDLYTVPKPGNRGRPTSQKATEVLQ